MIFEGVGLAIAGTLFLAMLGALDLGRRAALRRLASDPDGARTGTGAVEGAVFALLGLLIAFTFTGAAGRFDARRALVVEEANAVGTAWLRIDLLPAEDQPALREAFREYVDARIAVHELLPDVEAAEAELDRVLALQGKVWKLGGAAVARDGRPQIASLVLPAFNAMFDLGTTRVARARTHVPALIVAMLLGLALLGAVLAGFSMATPKGRSWLHLIAFAGIMALTIYVILDLEFPRAGVIRMDAADRAMHEARDSLR